MFGRLIADNGGRGFMFAIFAFVLTCGLLFIGKLDGSEWVTYNLSIGLGFMGAKAVSKLGKKGGDG